MSDDAGTNQNPPALPAELPARSERLIATCGLILATGGTGIAERDVTPEAIRGMMRVELPGFGETMRRESMKITPNAILSLSLAAVVERSLVLALPGKPSGAVECLGFVAGAIPHAVALAGARRPQLLEEPRFRTTLRRCDQTAPG